ncbi:hypothetical protein C2869_09725 [Saccharobesus litoralis]|uniref:SURF1-like protein n=1 Tax=Saccharobesus litoralis TaxID=2172099 RepID=A0A2S0VR50_9ALTE|nr:SURF1 family protein [Saccharobesus litoralis]AWB66691.1 hypothetical protein C2869_09725 [Saccharobesus litoralis]
MQITLGGFWPNVQVLTTIFVISVFTALMSLGFWQLDRADFKQLRMERINALQGQQVIGINQLPTQPEMAQDYIVVVEGQFKPDFMWLLENQVVNKKVGFDVIALLALVNGQHVLVNLGWIPANQNMMPMTNIQLPLDKVLFQAVVHYPKVNLLQTELPYTFKTSERLQQVIPSVLQEVLNVELLPFVLLNRNLQSKTANEVELLQGNPILADKVADKSAEKVSHQQKPLQPSYYISHWQQTVMPAEKHKAYAVQWFALAATWLILILWRFTKQCRITPKN